MVNKSNVNSQNQGDLTRLFVKRILNSPTSFPSQAYVCHKKNSVIVRFKNSTDASVVLDAERCIDAVLAATKGDIVIHAVVDYSVHIDSICRFDVLKVRSNDTISVIAFCPYCGSWAKASDLLDGLVKSHDCEVADNMYLKVSKEEEADGL